MKDRIKQSIKLDWQKIKALQPDGIKLPYNTAHLKKSLLKYGFSLPFYVWQSDGEYYCIDGHHRLDVLNELIAEGHKVPKELNAVEIEAKDRKEAISILVSVFNQKSNPFAEEYLIEFLEVEQISIEEVNIESVNVVSETIEEEETVLEAIEDDFDSTPPTEAITVLGDLYEIGEHRLLCGDSTDSEQVEKLMNGELADVGHNDPPYGMKKESEGVLNDNLNYSDLLNFNREWIALQFMHLKENGSWYCWGIDEPLMDIYSEILKPYIADQKATFRNLITWFKNPSGLGDGQNNPSARSYGIITEKCLFAMMGVQGFNNNADNYFKGWDSIVNYLDEQKNIAKFTIKDCKRLAGHSEKSGCHWFDKSQWMMPTKETYDSWRNNCIENNIDAFKKEYEEIKKEYEEIKKEWYSTRSYFDNTHDKMTEVWQFDRHVRQGDEGGHATPKPIPLCERAIKSSCPDGGLVIDFFLGSGSTMVASHQLKRKCYGMELDPKYADVIVKRMIKLDPTLNIKRNGVVIDKKEFE